MDDQPFAVAQLRGRLDANGMPAYGAHNAQCLPPLYAPQYAHESADYTQAPAPAVAVGERQDAQAQQQHSQPPDLYLAYISYRMRQISSKVTLSYSCVLQFNIPWKHRQVRTERNRLCFFRVCTPVAVARLTDAEFVNGEATPIEDFLA